MSQRRGDFEENLPDGHVLMAAVTVASRRLIIMVVIARDHRAVLVVMMVMCRVDAGHPVRRCMGVHRHRRGRDDDHQKHHAHEAG